MLQFKTKRGFRPNVQSIIGSTYREEARECLANESASIFINLARWEKETSTKTEVMCLISLMIPKISLICMSELIARISVELSEKHRNFEILKFPAKRRTERRAIASATSGDITKSFVAVPWPMYEPVESVNIHAEPALFERTSQAASDRQVTIDGSSVSRSKCCLSLAVLASLQNKKESNIFFPFT